MSSRGVFGLENIRGRQREGTWVPLPSVWTQPYLDDAGYFAGGESGVPDVSRIDKIAYSTDTKSTLTSNISAPLRHMGSSSSPTAGYTMGGYNSSTTSRTSKIDKLTYATQTTSLVPGNFSDTSTYAGAGGGSTTAGYLLQGSSPMVSYVRKITYATETIELLPGRVPNPVGNNAKMGSTGNGNTFLYVIGGSDGSGSEVKKLTYSNDSVSNIPNMPQPGSLNRAQKPGCASSTEAAYIVGGSNPYNNRIDKITFSNDTCSYASMNSTVPVPAGRINVAGTGLPSAGYFAGGTETSIVEKITYSTNSIARIPALDLTSGVSGATGFGAKGDNHESPVATRWKDGWKGTYDGGYWAGGQSTAPGGWPAPGNEYRSSIFKVNFSTDVGEISPSKLPKTIGSFHYVVADDVNGYLIGGDPSPDQEVIRVSMVSDTASLLPNASPSTRIRDNNDMGITYGKLYGYGQGGNNETLSPDEGTSSTAKFTFATETSGDAPSAKWSGSPAPRIYVSSVGNLTSHGYFTGGMTYKQSQPEYGKSDIAKMTYATETISEIPANLNGSFFYSATMSSETAGYITSNQYLPSWGANQQMNKITFATDTQSLLGAASSPEKSQSNGTGNGSAGYVGGGYRSTPASSFMTQVYKLDYATETAMTLIDSNWQGDSGTRGLYRGGAFGPLSAGRAAGGAPTPTPTSGYDPGNYELAPGIPNHGYYMGGNPASSMGNTNSMKMSFATDTLSTGVQLSEKYSTGGYGGGKMASSPSHAYAVYGRNPNGPGGETGNTWVRKVQYSNDTATNAPYATNEPSYAGFVAGTTTKLYYAGGIDNSNVPLGTRTNIRKLTYSTDSWATTPQSSANYSNPSGWPRNGSTSGGTPEYMLMGPSISANDYKTTIAKFTYATDTGIMSIPGVNGDNGQAYAVGNSNDTHWYMARGQTMPGYGKQTNIGKFTFATNTYESAALVDTTNDYNGQNGTGAVNNGMIAGYWAGAHYDQQDATSTLKVTYSTDTVTRGPNIPSGRYSPSASSGGGGNAFSGTTVQEFGVGGTRVPNVV